MEQIKILLVPADGPPAIGEIDPTLGEYQRLVGGYIEHVRHNGHNAYVDEDGLMKRLPPNVTASIVLDRPIVGPALFFGDDGGEKELGVPYATIQEVALCALNAADDPISAAVNLLRANGYQVIETGPTRAGVVEAAVRILRSNGYQVEEPRPDAEARVRKDAPDTSHLVEPKLGSQMRRVLLCIGTYQPITDDAVEERLELTHQSVSAARRTLVLRGLVVDSGRRGKTRSGNKAILWVTPDRYAEFAQ